MPVYLIRAGENGPVKIGHARSLTDRLTKMQTDNHERLVVLRWVDGDMSAERELHQRFSNLRRRGDWFEYSDKMLGEIGLADLPRPMPSRPPKNDHPLSAYLRDIGLTQGKFASAINVDQTAVSRWLRGARYPRPPILRRIIAMTNGKLTAADFLSGSEAA